MSNETIHQSGITPTRNTAVLDIGNAITLFANRSVITVNGTGQVNHSFGVERIHNIQFVRMKPGNEGDGSVYKKMISPNYQVNIINDWLVNCVFTK